MPNSDGNIGRVDAIKLADRSQVWSYRNRAPETPARCCRPAAGWCSPAPATAISGRFDDTTGKVLWQVRPNNVVNSFPITYSVNGKQYVAVAVGSGSGHSKALATLTPDIKNPDGGSVLWVFALPDH